MKLYDESTIAEFFLTKKQLNHIEVNDLTKDEKEILDNKCFIENQIIEHRIIGDESSGYKLRTKLNDYVWAILFVLMPSFGGILLLTFNIDDKLSILIYSFGILLFQFFNVKMGCNRWHHIMRKKCEKIEEQ